MPYIFTYRIARVILAKSLEEYKYRTFRPRCYLYNNGKETRAWKARNRIHSTLYPVFRWGAECRFYSTRPSADVYNLCHCARRMRERGECIMCFADFLASRCFCEIRSRVTVIFVFVCLVKYVCFGFREEKNGNFLPRK